MSRENAIDRGRPHDDLPAPWRIAVDAILEEPTPLIDTQRLYSDEMVQVGSSDSLLSPDATGRSVSPVPRLQGLRYGIALAVSLAIVFGVVWSGVFDRHSRLAFADVQKKIETVRSVQFTETRKAESGRPAERSRVMISGRYRKRVEHFDEAGNLARISITDASSGKHVILDPAKKLFKVLTAQVSINMDSGERIEAGIKPTPEADFYSHFRDFKPDALHEPKRREINGQPALSFVQTKLQEYANGESSTFTRTVWVDKHTKKPVRIETSDRSTDKRLGPSDWVQEDFVFDEELDQSLFSTDPPEGYRVQTSKVFGISPTPAAKP